MTKDRILLEIKRTASENGGVALGMDRFQAATGIAPSIWRGKLWRSWNAAVEEAGLVPNSKNKPIERDVLIVRLLEVVRRLGRFPTYDDLRIERQRDPTLPFVNVFNRLGDHSTRIAVIRAYAAEHSEYHGVLAVLPSGDEVGVVDGAADDQLADGSVYLVRHGKHYKIGRTYDVPRRHRQIDLELPEKLVPIHAIRTDDPAGIEAYWHARFAAKRMKGEWFDLSTLDVRAFKRRRFM